MESQKRLASVQVLKEALLPVAERSLEQSSKNKNLCYSPEIRESKMKAQPWAEVRGIHRSQIHSQSQAKEVLANQAP